MSRNTREQNEIGALGVDELCAALPVMQRLIAVLEEDRDEDWEPCR